MINKYLLISIFEIIYIYYMIFIFKTRYNFDRVFWKNNCNWGWIKYLNKITNNYFYHGCKHTKIANSFICPFGVDFSRLVMFWLFTRNIIPNKYLFINKYFVILSLLFSLFNLNAFLRMIPIFYIEYNLRKTYI